VGGGKLAKVNIEVMDEMSGKIPLGRVKMTLEEAQHGMFPLEED
jgi:hypothetical protein